MVKVPRRKIIVGHANTFHDPAIVLIEGNQIFAEAIERHSQCKRAIEIPRLWYSWRAVHAALSNLGIKPISNADIVTVSSWDYDKVLNHSQKEKNANWKKGAITSPMLDMQVSCLWLEPIFDGQVDWIFRDIPPDLMLVRPPREKWANISHIQDVSWQSKSVSHHLAHAATAVYTSSFDECVVMVIDGYGEEQPISFYHFENNSFKWLNQNDESDSLGILYSIVTQLCGFNYVEGEEWKVMGLAAYGEYRPEIYNFFKKYVSVEGLTFRFQFANDAISSELESLVGGFRHYGDPDVMKAADLAHNFQKWFEDIIIKLVQTVSQLGLSKNLAYAGGCALNSSASGKILGNSDFEQLHIPSAPADDGNAIGVALYEKYYVQGDKREKKILSPYLGSTIDLQKLEHILSFNGTKFYKMSDESALCSEAANLLAAGNIIGWVQGKAEFGPRALGNRSILADPRPSDMKDKINNRVKFREPYRPLAPSILHEFGNEYFENYQESPYMERTLVFRKEVSDRVPAVVHQNGTGRVQTVKEEWNPLYHRLIHTFYKNTGIPILLNTSFNVMGKPIIHTVEDAMTVFYTTGMDYLIIGNYVLYK